MQECCLNLAHFPLPWSATAELGRQYYEIAVEESARLIRTIAAGLE